MERISLRKTVTASAVMVGIAIAGAGSAHAAPSESSAGGAHVEQSQTNGSTAIRTSPSTRAEVWTFGPHVSPVMVWLVAD